MTTPDEDPATQEFANLQSRGQAAFENGRVGEAIELLTRALEQAEERGDRRRTDLAFCNLSAITIQLDTRQPLSPRDMNRLREILMRNEDLTNCRLAAYLLARAYELQKEARKGLFYGQIGLDRSHLLARPDWIASSQNQIGNLLMAQSRFEEAAEHYQRALEIHPHEAEERRALIRVNLGYSCLMRDQQRRGFELLYRSLRTLRHLGARREQITAHIDLCYAHLEAGRLRDALRHGKKGLVMAEEFQDADATKNALYLLGQTANLLGDEVIAHGYFQDLQESFYPGSSGIPEFLMAIDVRKMINLRA